MKNTLTVVQIIQYIEDRKNSISRYTSQIVGINKLCLTPVKTNNNGIIFFENPANQQILAFFYKNLNDFENDLKSVRHLKSDDMNAHTRCLTNYTNFVSMDRFSLPKGVKTLLKV